MKRFLNNLFGGNKTLKNRKTRDRRVRLGVESLEDRRLMAFGFGGTLGSVALADLVSLPTATLSQTQLIAANPSVSIASQVTSTWLGDAVSLNPQPLPPRVGLDQSLFSLGDTVSLNPQPLPPRVGLDQSLFSLGDTVSLNPQPLPPRVGLDQSLFSLGDTVSLNPQPLPPLVSSGVIGNVFNPVDPLLVVIQAQAVAFQGIHDKYAQMGGDQGALGACLLDNQVSAAGNWYALYEHGAIYDTDTGAHEVHGLIWVKYQALGADGSFLGLPTSDEMDAPGGRVSNFAGGSVFYQWGADQAFETHGLIRDKYFALGGAGSFLGLPTSDEMDVPGGRVSHFQWGSVFYQWGAAQAFEVHGLIRDKYLALGGGGSFLGLPTSDEMDAPGGRVSQFQWGTVFYEWGAAQAFEVHGAIRDKYFAMGGAGGVLGLPTSDEFTDDWGVRVSLFDHGYIHWTPDQGVMEGVQLSGIPGGSPQDDGWSCGPNSAARFLQFYGFNVSYGQIRSEVLYDGDLVSRVKMGTRPSVLLDEIRRYRPETQLETRVDQGYGEGGLNHILDLVASGKPVIALINTTGNSHDVGDFGPFTAGHLPDELHWVVVTGYDRNSRTVNIMNTNGVAETWSFDTFNQRWNWSAGGAVGDFLTGTLNTPERTIIY